MSNITLIEYKNVCGSCIIAGYLKKSNTIIIPGTDPTIY